MPKIPENPFEKIAISCSGGGYRATAYHLGSLSYMDRIQFQGKPLIENIKTISTVSGGTIMGVVYASMKAKRHSFKEIYTFLLGILRDFDLIEEGLHLLNNEEYWKDQHKTKNVINALAVQYDQKYTNGETFKIFEDLSHCHLDEVIFNATEFTTGINFRFKNEGVFGNNYHRIKQTIANEVKLGDIIAASSCFPGGFEPMAFPNDFAHPDAKYLSANENALGLMDGGIYDNQGIESILISEKNKSDRYYDLIIISDVTSPQFESFNFTKSQKGGRKNTMSFPKAKNIFHRSLYRIKWFLASLSVLGLLFAYSKDFGNHWITGVGLTLSAITLCLFLMLNIFIKWSKRRLDALTKSITTAVPPDILKKLSAWNLSSLTIDELKPLLLDRANSLKTLVGDIFLKRIRQLQFEKIYGYDNPQFMYRRVSNLIKDLTEVNFKKPSGLITDLPLFPQELLGNYNHVIGFKLKALAEKASGFGTTLWFTPDDQVNEVLDKLIACGQATMCYNLLNYLLEFMLAPDNGFDDLSEDRQNEIGSLYAQCLEDWRKFKKDPMFMTVCLSGLRP